MKTKLLEKIASKEAWDSLKSQLTLSYAQSDIIRHNNPTDAFSDYWPWWAMREAYRMALGAYELSTVLSQLNKSFPIFAHVSVKDPKMVAFTPDRQSGESDRQVLTSIGKLLSRFYVLSTENAIREMVERHNAEVNIELIYISGQAIPEFYKSIAPTGLGACMSKDHFPIEPSDAYDAEGVQLVYTVDAKGAPNSRTLLYTNAEGKTVYIRCYGNPALKKKLEKLGIPAGTLVGAKLKAVKFTKPESGYARPSHEDYEGLWALPYIDANNAQSQVVGSTVALLDDHFLVLNAEQLNAIKVAELTNYTAMGSSGGFSRIEPIPADKLTLVDEYTGDKYNVLTDTLPKFVRLWDKAQDRIYKTAINNVQEMVLCRDGLYAKAADTVLLGGSFYRDDETCLKSNGFVKLSALYYPDDRGWYSYGLRALADGTHIKAEDAISIVKSNGFTGYAHKSEDLTQYIKLHAVSGFSTLAHPDSGWVKTDTGRKVHTAIHEIVETIHGTWSFKRGKMRTDILGRAFWHTRGLSSEKVLEGAAVKRHVEEFLDFSADFVERVFDRLLQTGLRYREKFIPTGRRDLRDACGGYSYVNLQRLRSLYLRSGVSAIFLELLAIFLRPETYESEGLDTKTRRAVSAYFAEMTAEEAPHYLHLLPVAEVDVLPEPSLTVF